MVNGKPSNLMQPKILRIKSDASFRTFYRFISKKKNKIIVLAKEEKYQNLIAYSSINQFLRSKKILAPKLYAHDISKGIIIIEDFGDVSFYKVLIKTNDKFSVYKKLVDLLLKIQTIKPKTKIKNIENNLHTINKYTNRYLHVESDLFFDWYLPIFFNKKKSLNIKKKIKKILSKLYKQLNFSNSCFVHRDYHVQNLMKVGSKIGLIDNQDAMIGNPAYDLASLIDDVRIKTSIKLKNQIYNYYIKKKNKIYKIDEKDFLQDFNILSVQRCFKIIGIFSRLFKRDKKKQYLKLIPYTWRLLENRMDGKFFFELKKILNDNISKKIKNKIIN